MFYLFLSTIFYACQRPLEDQRYQSAELSPPFEHGNATWAGVALLDFDGDGWLDIFFSNGFSQPDALYRNMDGLFFVDVASEVGLDNIDQHGGVASADLDNDGDPDLVVLTECSLGTLHEEGLAFADGRVNIAWNQGGEFVWEEVRLTGQAAEFGICPVSVELVDINGDGWLDIHVSNGLDPDQIYPWIFRKVVNEAVDFLLLSNGRGEFTFAEDVFEPVPELNLQPDEFEFQFVTFTSVFMDVNLDGRLDKIAGFGGGPLGIYLQDSAGGFTYSTDIMPSQWGVWMGMAVADFDGDGDFDIYGTNEGLSPYILGFDNLTEVAHIVDNHTIDQSTITPYHEVVQNQFAETGRFAFVSSELETEQFLPGDIEQNAYGLQVDYLTSFEHPMGLERLGWSWAATTLDINLDGWMDVVFNSNNCASPMCIVEDAEHGAEAGTVLLNMQAKPSENASFQDVGDRYGVFNVFSDGQLLDGRGVAVGDLNNDGAPDIVYANKTFNPTQSSPLAQIPGFPIVYLSPKPQSNWLQIDLVGTSSNRDGIGALIGIDDGQKKRFYLFEPGGTTNSSNERLFMVGLGETERVDIAVRFPSGEVTRENGVRANQRIQIVE